MATVREMAPPPRVPELESDPGYYDRLAELIRGLSEGATTGALGGPVDLVNMVLTPLGLGSERPVMGSEDIRQRLTDVGVYQPRSGRPAEAVGEFVGAMAAPGPDPLQWAALGLGLPLMMGKVGKAADAVPPTVAPTPRPAPTAPGPYVERVEAINPRKDWDRIIRPAKGEIWTPGTFFDYTRLRDVPDVPQTRLPRLPEPPKGYPKWLTDLGSDENIKRAKGYIEKGIKLGGPEWYNTDPMRKGFVDELGEEAGNAAHQFFADLMAITSPRTPVMQNIKSASLLFQRARAGMGHELVPGAKLDPMTDRPVIGIVPELLEGYGGITQADWIENLNARLRQGFIDPLRKPKTSAYGSNIGGNWAPYTVDAHDIASWWLPEMGKAPKSVKPQLYPFLEQLGQRVAGEVGMAPPQAQASKWFGAGAETGVRSPYEPLLRSIERRIEYTAKQRDQSMSKVFSDFAKGKAPLLGIGPMAAMLYRAVLENQGLLETDEEDGT